MYSTKLTLKNMLFFGRHGVSDAEKRLGQKIEVDVEIVANLTNAAQNDDLTQTINYAELYHLTRQVVEQEQFNLIEGIGYAILNLIREKYQPQKITVRVRKPQPPVGGLVESAEFEISGEF